ncbi:MAG: pyridoxal-phosphate dependent enzyme, partial [Nitrospinota bacterium]|nr:pyridoxal-phosphate dependent enzyme [Nitrospinota bacterium]
LKGQLDAQGVTLDSIVCCLGTGGTLAGVLMGVALHGLPARSYGVLIQRDARYFTGCLDALFEDAVRDLAFPVRVPRGEIRIIEGYAGPGYGLNTPEELSLIAGLAREEGVLLDPVYTGKTFLALDDLLRTGNPPADALGQNILYIHTGGIFGLFPKREALEAALEGDRRETGTRENPGR